MCTPPPFLLGVGGSGGLSPLLNFQKGGAWQDLSPQISGSQRVVAGEDMGDFFQGEGGGAVFPQKIN